MNSLKSCLLHILLILAGVLIVVSILTPVGVAEAQSNQEVIRGLNASNQSGGESQIQQVIRAALNLFSIVIGVAGVLFVMVAGFKYLTSNGDPGQIAGAQRTLLYALAGLAVAALAQIIVRFALGRVVN